MSYLLTDGPTRKTREQYLSETPAELVGRMERLLKSRDLLPWIANGIEEVGVAGERFLAMILYLVGTSRLLDKPLSAIVQGPSTSGKSHTIDCVAKLFPPEAVKPG